MPKGDQDRTERRRSSSGMARARNRLPEVVPPDQAERDAIVDWLDVTMLVEASAGAGKTQSMVDRMLALLREGKCRIDTLAAITFTRKAAAELRARFRVALEKAAREAEGSGILLQPILHRFTQILYSTV